jgi:hypothetical protein
MHTRFPLRRLAVAAAFLPLAAAGHDVFDVPACDAPQPPSAYIPACLLPVPNGDFRGVDAPLGSETGEHWHPWEPTFRWFGLPPRLHDPVEHLKPWQFIGDGRPAYRDEIRGKPGMVLAPKQGVIYQWVPVTSFDGTQAHEVAYTVRVTYAPHATRSGGQIVGPTEAPVAMALTLVAADTAAERVPQVFHDRQVASEYRPATYTATLTVPANTSFHQLGISIEAEGDVPLVVEKVELLEKTSFFFDD